MHSLFVYSNPHSHKPLAFLYYLSILLLACAFSWYRYRSFHAFSHDLHWCKTREYIPDSYYECKHYKLQLYVTVPRAGKRVYFLSKMHEGDSLILEETADHSKINDIVFKYNQVEKYWEHELKKSKWIPENFFLSFIPEHPDCYRIEIENKDIKTGELKLIWNPLQ